MELTKRVLRAIYTRTWDVIEELNVRLGSWQSREVFVVVVRVGHVCSLNWVMTLHWYIRGKVEDDRSMIDAEIALFIQVRTYYVRTPPHINQSSGKHYLENNDVCSTNLFIQMSFCFLIWLRLRIQTWEIDDDIIFRHDNARFLHCELDRATSRYISMLALLYTP